MKKHMNYKNKKILISPIALITLLALIGSMVPLSPNVQAAGTLTDARAYLNTLDPDQSSGVEMIILLKPASVGTEAKVKIEFPTDNTNDDTKWCRNATTVTVATDTTKESATGLLGTLSASCTQTDDIITITGVSDLTVGTMYGVKLSGSNIGTGLAATTGVITISTLTSGDVAIDTKQIAVDIIASDQISITSTVLPSLTFAITDAAVNLLTLTSSSTGSDTAAFTVATNAGSGYVTDISGSTLTNGDSDTITAIGATKAASSTNTEQFGLNLKDNTTPNIGSEASGGSGAAAGQYATVDQFAFQSGDTIASASVSSTTTTFTISFIANITGATEPGTYTSNLTLIATGKF